MLAGPWVEAELTAEEGGFCNIRFSEDFVSATVPVVSVNTMRASSCFRPRFEAGVLGNPQIWSFDGGCLKYLDLSISSALKPFVGGDCVRVPYKTLVTNSSWFFSF